MSGSTSGAAPDLDALYEQAGQRFNVDPALLRAVAGAETGGLPNPDNATSSAGAMGRMQVMPATYATVAKQYGLGSDPRDPTNNIMAGAAVLSQNLSQFGNVRDALRAYDGGTDPTKWGNSETSAYPGRVASFYRPNPPPQQSSSSPPVSGGDPWQVASADTTRTDVLPRPSAPSRPSISGTPANTLSDDAMHALLTGGSAPGGTSPPVGAAPASVPAQRGPAGMSDDQMHALLTGGSTGTPPASSSASGSAAAQGAGTGSGGFLGGLQRFGQGVETAVEGVPNALNRFGAYVDQNVPALAAVDQAALPALGMQQPSTTSAALTSDLAARDKANAGSYAYGAGKLAGDLAVTAPTMAFGGEALGAAADATPFLDNALATSGQALRALPGGKTIATVGGNALAGASQGAAAGAITSGQSDEPFWKQVGLGAATGGVLGPALAGGGKIASSIAGGLQGGSISPETAALANLARTTYGIPLTAAQISESPGVRFVSSAASRVPLAGGGADDAGTQAAFNTAVSRTFGENAPKITPAVMAAAKTRLGNTFDQIASTGSFQADNQLVNDLAGIETDAQTVLPQSEWRPISAQLDNVLGSVDQQGNISGDAYQVLTRKGAPLDRAQSSSDPNVSYYAGQVRDALDDALARGLPPDQQQALQVARSQYKALKTVEPLAGKSVTGNISPPSLMTPVRTSYGDIAYSGGGPLGDLARIGQLMKEPPSSGTAERLSAIGAMRDIAGAGAGAVAGVMHPVDAAAILGSLGGTSLAARGARAYLNSDVVTNRLIANGLSQPAVASPYANALAAASLPAATLALDNPNRNPLAAYGN